MHQLVHQFLAARLLDLQARLQRFQALLDGSNLFYVGWNKAHFIAQIQLDRLLRGRTAIVIAHRRSTIERADRIVVLHHGVVREVGTHAELLALGQIYARLYELQYAGGRSSVDANATDDGASAGS